MDMEKLEKISRILDMMDEDTESNYCPECDGDIEINEYYDGRCKRVEVYCTECDWESEL